MAWIVTRSPIGRLLNVAFVKTCKTPRGVMHPGISIQVANISGATLRDKTKKRPAPYPYEEKGYGFFNAIFDHTTHRFNENSKLVVVEGPIGVGKSTFVKTLAEDLDMLHMPEVNMDMQYIDSYGTDMRNYKHLFPESCKAFDLESFYATPNHQNVANFQIQMYILRYSQYIDALAHILNTGQGVVLERCAFSDFVFLEAMVKCGYVSKAARSVYYELVDNSLSDLLKPHLVIYLDIPVSKVQERIKQRNDPNEVKTKVLTSEYLGHIEHFYKQRYLKEISTHAELLIYDWSNFGDVEVVVEDIERINFEGFDKHDPKMRDWRMADEWHWNETRMMYTTKVNLMSNFLVPRFDVPELIIPADDMLKRDLAMEEIPGKKYREGYNADAGDTGILFKTKISRRT